jgi:hypothetical protein
VAKEPQDPSPALEGGDSPEEGARDRRAFLLRLPPDLHAELRAWANQELRSLNAHLEFLLREAVKRRRGMGE